MTPTTENPFYDWAKGGAGGGHKGGAGGGGRGGHPDPGIKGGSGLKIFLLFIFD